MQAVAIVPAAGLGVRLRSRHSKPLVRIKGIPLIVYTLRRLSRHPQIKEVIVAANPLNIRAINSAIKKFRISKVSKVVLGGATRRVSVENALAAVANDTELVLVHDAVRPFIRKGIISRVIGQAACCGAAVVGVPVKATIKKIAILNRPGGQAACRIVKETVDRHRLYEIQTPQVFRKDLILKAYKKFRDRGVTDDSALVERLGVKVALVLGSYDNIKITTPEDLQVAEAILSRKA
jgi:2-C-methyl-D-erythritol 4-phosphate cytidylyltransferase